MIHFKILDDEGVIVGAEAYEDPAPYVKIQERNHLLVRCSEPEAEGLLAGDNNTIYRLTGRTMDSDEISDLTAVFITDAEYDAIIDELAPPDPEDEDPDVPPGTDEDEILTRAELTEQLRRSQEQIEFLEECLMEMSEIVYAG